MTATHTPKSRVPGLPRSLTFIPLIAAAMAFLMAGPVTAQPDTDGARAFIQRVIDEAFEIIRDEDLEAEERKNLLREMAHREVAIDYIARLSLGRHGRAHDGMSPEQRANHNQQVAEYRELFPDYIFEKLYDLVIGEFETSTVEIVGAEPIRQTDVFVTTHIRRAGREAIISDWRVRPDDSGEFTIVDLRAEGISLTITQRDDFASIIGGGDLTRLVAHMRESLAKSHPTAHGPGGHDADKADDLSDDDEFTPSGTDM